MEHSLPSLHQLLHQFEQNGWVVNYSNLSLWGRLQHDMHDTVIRNACVIKPREEMFEIAVWASTAHPFNEHAQRFLMCVEDQLSHFDVDFTYANSTDCRLTVRKSCGEGFENLDDMRLKGVIEMCLSSAQRFIYTCAHVLNTYARLEREANINLPHHLYPEHQASFCLFDQLNGYRMM